MCLILSDTKCPEIGSLTMFKVYTKVDQSIQSPIFFNNDYRTYSGSIIRHPGTYEASMDTWYCVKDAVIPPGPPQCYSYTVLPQHIGRSIDTSGFHCLTSIQSAKAYKSYLLRHRYHNYSRPLLIVPVVVEVKDVFAVGTTPVYDWHVDEGLPTYVTKNITITQNAFDTAMKGQDHVS